MAGDVMVRLWEGEDTDGQSVVALVAMVEFTGQGQAAPVGLVSIPPPTMEDACEWAMAIINGATTIYRDDEG